MKHTRGKRIRWDPIIINLLENKVMREFWTGKNDIRMFSTIKEDALVSQERRSRKDFETYLKSLFDNDSLKVKYQNPDAWSVYNLKRKDNSR